MVRPALSLSLSLPTWEWTRSSYVGPNNKPLHHFALLTPMSLFLVLLLPLLLEVVGAAVATAGGGRCCYCCCW